LIIEYGLGTLALTGAAFVALFSAVAEKSFGNQTKIRTAYARFARITFVGTGSKDRPF